MSVVVGLGLITCGCLSTAVGMAMMKLSGDVEGGKPLHKKWRWMLGFVFLVVNATALDLWAYGMVPLALVAPFAGLTIVFSLLLARSGLLHKREHLSRRQLIGATLVLVGVTAVSVWGPHAANANTMGEILAYFGNPGFIAFAVVTLSMVSAYVCVMHCRCLRHLKPSPTSIWTTALSAYTAAACGALSQLFIKVVSLAVHEVSERGLSALRYPACALATRPSHTLHMEREAMARAAPRLC